MSNFYEFAFVDGAKHERIYNPKKQIDFCRVREAKSVLDTEYDGVTVVSQDMQHLTVRYSGFSRTTKIPVNQCFDFLYKGSYEDSDGLTLTPDDIQKAVERTKEAYEKERKQYPQ